MARLGIALPLAANGKQGVRLVEKGRARAVIVVVTGAGDPAREAPRQLPEYLGRISGARLGICDEAAPVAGPQTLVGRSERARRRGVDHRIRQNPKNPFDIDVTPHLRPGQANHFAVLIGSLPPDRIARGGLHRRVLIWSPNATR